MNQKSSHWLYFAGALALGMIFYTMPLLHDGYWYLADTERLGILGCAREHFLHDNARLTNLLGGVWVSLPLWITSTLSAIAVFASWWLMARISHAKGNLGALTFLALAYVFFIPWDNYLFELVFAWNYIWSTAWLLGAIAVFTSKRHMPMSIYFVVGFICGGCHEIAGVPALLGAVLVLVFHKSLRITGRFAFVIGTAVGLALIASSPALFDFQGSMFHPSLFSAERLFDLPLQECFLALWAIYFCIGSLRNEALSPVIIFAVAVSAVGMAVALTTNTPRAMTPSVVLSAVGLVRLLCPTFGSNNKIFKTICLAAWLFIYAHLVASFITGLKFHRQQAEIVELYQQARKDQDGVVFYDVINDFNSPWLSFGKPCTWAYRYFDNEDNLSRYFGDGPRLKVVPEALRNFSYVKGEPLPGSAGAVAWKGYVVTPCENNAVNAAGKKGVSLAIPFMGADGRKYYFLRYLRGKKYVIDEI